MKALYLATLEATKKWTMPIRHKPGDKMMVDWSGKYLQLHNPETGAVFKAYIFVGTLPFSMYCFAEVFTDMKEVILF